LTSLAAQKSLLLPQKTEHDGNYCFRAIHSMTGHHENPLPLLNNRPLWDLLLIAGSIGGLLISLTGIVIGWRRLAR